MLVGSVHMQADRQPAERILAFDPVIGSTKPLGRFPRENAGGRPGEQSAAQPTKASVHRPIARPGTRGHGPRCRENPPVVSPRRVVVDLQPSPAPPPSRPSPAVFHHTTHPGSAPHPTHAPDHSRPRRGLACFRRREGSADNGKGTLCRQFKPHRNTGFNLLERQILILIGSCCRCC